MDILSKLLKPASSVFLVNGGVMIIIQLSGLNDIIFETPGSILCTW